jgi:transposase-like protein
VDDSTDKVRLVPLTEAQDVLTDVLRRGAQQLLAQAVEAEVADWIDRRRDCRDSDGLRQVVRNGHLPQRTFTTGLGPVAVQQPRVHDRRPAERREKFSSTILPPYLRKTQSIEELIPWLYLKGVSSGDFSEALAALLGRQAQGVLPRRRSRGSRAFGKKSITNGANGPWPANSTFTSGPTGSTSTSAWREAGSVFWS